MNDSGRETSECNGPEAPCEVAQDVRHCRLRVSATDPEWEELGRVREGDADDAV